MTVTSEASSRPPEVTTRNGRPGPAASGCPVAGSAERDRDAVQQDPAAAGVDRGRLRQGRTAGELHRGHVAADVEDHPRGEDDGGRQRGGAAVDRQPRAGEVAAQRGQVQGSGAPRRPPGEPPLGDDVEADVADDDQARGPGTGLPGRAHPLPGRGELGDPSRFGGRGAGLLLRGGGAGPRRAGGLLRAARAESVPPGGAASDPVGGCAATSRAGWAAASGAGHPPTSVRSAATITTRRRARVGSIPVPPPGPGRSPIVPTTTCTTCGQDGCVSHPPTGTLRRFGPAGAGRERSTAAPRVSMIEARRSGPDRRSWRDVPDPPRHGDRRAQPRRTRGGLGRAHGRPRRGGRARGAGERLVRHGRARRHRDDHDRAPDEPAGRGGRARRPGGCR